MEIIEENKITKEALSGVSLSSQPSDDPHKILKPSFEDKLGNDLWQENGGVATVVVTTATTVIEKTKVSVVEMIQKDKDEILKNQEKGEGNEMEGFFSNLIGDDEEGMKVNCSENGMSLVMDGENGSEVNHVIEGNAGSLTNEHEENADGDDPMDVCLSGQNEKNDENGTEIFDFNEDMNENNQGNVENKTEIFGSNEDTNKNDEGNVENGKENMTKIAENEEESEEEEEDHDYVVGDFVWGKIKSHPWWPGQIYDPSDASDYALTLKRKGRLLVAYFGDGSFSWCSPSQLKPFIENFKEMSNQSDSKKFVNAVRKGLEQVSKLVEAELVCKCQTFDWVENADVVNGGIKSGVPVPKGNTIKVLMGQMQPVEIVSILKDSATMEAGTRLSELELTVVKSCLSVFYRLKGGYLLAEYRHPKCIEGLEDVKRSGVVGDSDMNNGPGENGDDKLYRNRKQKSVAELLGEDEPTIKKTKKERKRKVALVVSVSPESDHESGGGGGGGGVEDETMSPRQRKKSKYLSPPYLSPIWTAKLSGSGSGSFKEAKTEDEKVPEMAAKQLEESFKKSSGKKKSREKKRVREGFADTNGGVNVKKVVNGLLRAALDPSYYVEKNITTVTDFISSFRKSNFEEGSKSNYQAAASAADGKKDSSVRRKRVAEETSSGLAFIKEKLETMSEMVKKCEENEMSGAMKASLEAGITEVLDKVGKMRAK